MLEIAAAAGFDLVVVDLAHSTLGEAEAFLLLRYADALGLPALVRLPRADPSLVNRVLEAGGVGVQLSMLRSVAQREELQAAVAYAPVGRRSVALAHTAAGYGAVPLGDYLAAERADPPLVVGQIEGRTAEPLEQVVAGPDVAFVGTTDLTVALGLDPADTAGIRTEVDAVARAARGAGVAFGGQARGSASGVVVRAAWTSRLAGRAPRAPGPVVDSAAAVAA